MKPGGLWMGSKLAVQVYPAQPTQRVRGSSVWVSSWQSAQHSHTPFWQGPPARCPAGSWQGRKQVVVVLRYDWCDSEEASADGGCRFIVLPACGLEQALSSSSCDQGPASKLQQGLYGSADRQKDAFLAREHPTFVIRCEVIQCWILRGTLAILLSSWKQRTQGELSLMLHHCGLRRGWQWTRH